MLVNNAKSEVWRLVVSGFLCAKIPRFSFVFMLMSAFLRGTEIFVLKNDFSSPCHGLRGIMEVFFDCEIPGSPDGGFV